MLTINEKKRLDSVRSYRVVNDSAKEDFDQIARVAAILCNVPVVLISLMDSCNQHFITHYGIDLTEVPIEETFCQVLFQDYSKPLIVPDARLDERFKNNQYVTGYPNIQFYAGFPLINSDNYILGTVCVIDHKPRKLSSNQMVGLECLVNQIHQIFELQKKSYDLGISKKLFEEKSNRFSNIIEASNVGTWEWNLDSGEIVFNEKLAEMLGYSLEELQPATKETLRNKMHRSDLKGAKQKLADYFNGVTDFYTCEYRLRHKKGNWVWILDRGRALKWDEKGIPLLMFGTHTDITLRKVASEKLTDLNKRLRVAQKIAKLGYWEFNKRKKTAFWSDQIYEIWEVNPNEEIFNIEYLEQTIHPEDLNLFNNQVFGETYGMEVNFQFRIIVNTNKIKWISASKVTNLEDSNLIEGTFQDITSQKQLKISLFESEKRYSDLFQLMPIPSWVYDLNTLRITDVNKAAEKDYGYTRDEFLSMTIKDIRPQDEVAHLLNVIEHTRSNTEDYKIGIYKHRRKDSSVFKVEVHSNHLYRNNDLSRVVMSVNISETLKYIEEIEDQNATLQEIARIQSHVVRAPLAKMMGIIDLINEGINLNSEENSLFLNEILNSAKELDKIIRTIAAKASQLKNN